VTPEERYDRRPRSPSADRPPRPRRSRSQRHRNDHESFNRDDRNGRRGRYSHRNGDRPRSQSRSPTHFSRSSRPLPSQNDAFNHDPSTGPLDSDFYKDKDGNFQRKEKPNWAPSGKLAAAANTIKTANKAIVLKYHEPAEARKPPTSQPWRMYVFKGEEILDTIELGMQSCWLFGREEAVVDVLLEHQSCSKQHAVLQWRFREERGEFGERKGRVKGYVLDLESANGTTVNGEDVGKARYYEVRSGDVVKFGHSEREYMLQLPPREEKKDDAGG
jgi:smad nuclear-interacting protein 1